MAIVTLAFRAADVAGLTGSGFLVPPVDGRVIKASTFSFNKWDWVRAAGDGVLVLRTCSAGTARSRCSRCPTRTWSRPPSPTSAPPPGCRRRPVDAHVQRWGGALPQYAVGHLDRVARIRAAVAAVPGLAVCGAAYDGVGIPAVIASAHRARASLAPAE